MIAVVIGYDSIRKHLAECVMNTRGIREKYHPYGCVDRYKNKVEHIGVKPGFDVTDILIL